MHKNNYVLITPLVFSNSSYIKFTSEFWSLIITHIYIVTSKAIKSSILREVSACPRGPKAVLFRLAKFSLRGPASTDCLQQVNDNYVRTRGFT
jgi:hypothetical protein